MTSDVDDLRRICLENVRLATRCLQAEDRLRRFAVATSDFISLVNDGLSTIDDRIAYAKEVELAFNPDLVGDKPTARV